MWGGPRGPELAHSDLAIAIWSAHKNMYQFYMCVLRDDPLCCLCNIWRTLINRFPPADRGIWWNGDIRPHVALHVRIMWIQHHWSQQALMAHVNSLNAPICDARTSWFKLWTLARVKRKRSNGSFRQLSDSHLHAALGLHRYSPSPNSHSLTDRGTKEFCGLLTRACGNLNLQSDGKSWSNEIRSGSIVETNH